MSKPSGTARAPARKTRRIAGIKNPKYRPPKPKAPTQPEGIFSLVVALVALCCCCAGALVMYLQVSGFYHLAPALLGAAAAILLCTLAYCLPAARRWLLLCGGAVYGVALALCWGLVVPGALYAARRTGSAFTKIYPEVGSVALPSVQPWEEPSAAFLFFAAALFAALLAWAVLWRRSFLLCALGTLPLFWYAFALVGLPHPVPTVLLVCGWLGLLIKGQAGRFKQNAGARLSAGAMALAALYLVGILAAFPRESYTALPVVFRLRSTMTDAFYNIRAELPFGAPPGFLQGAPLSGRGNVSLSQAGHLRFADETALKVRGDLLNARYLRGFAASTYTGQGWQAAEEETYNAANLPFQPLTYEGPTLWPAGVGPGPYTLEVEMQRSSTYCFTPYLLEEATYGEAAQAPTFFADAYLRAPRGERAYSARYHASQADPLFYLNDPQRRTFAEQQAQWAMGGFSYGTGVYEVEGGLYVYDPATQSSTFYAGTPSAIAEVPATSSEEAAYRAYISQQYTQLPQGLSERLRAIAAQAGLHPAETAAEWESTAMRVANYVQNSGSYTQTPGSQPRDADFVEYFLTQSRQGYCVHFASAAVAVLRALGVPARYVEGYVLGTVPEATRNFVDVPAENAHAWAEVWIPAFGWLPLEVTPGGADFTREEGEETALGSSSSAPTASQSVPAASSSSSAAQSVAASSQSGGAGSGAGGRLPLWALGGVVAALCLGLALLALWEVRRRNKAQRTARFKNEDTNDAVLAMYQYLLRLKRFAAGTYSILPPVEALAEKALFSQHTLTRAEWHTVEQEMVRARKTVLGSLRGPKKWLFVLLGL